MLGARALPRLAVGQHLHRRPHLQDRVGIGRDELAAAQLVDHQRQVEAVVLEQPLELLVELPRRQVVRDRQVVERVADDQVVLPGVGL